MRINKYIAKSGFCSRRKADSLISSGKVKVNGKILEDFSYDTKDDDVISVDGQILQIEKHFYYKLNKPIDFITSNFDPHNKKDLNDLIFMDQRFFAAGRLDKDSHGLLIITNDGDFANALTHPSHEISKEYIVKVDRILSKKDEEKFKNGLDIGNGEITCNSYLKLIGTNTYRVIIKQGYNRQIRRMFQTLGSNVTDLCRIRIGAINLDGLKLSYYKVFDKKEMEFVRLIKNKIWKKLESLVQEQVDFIARLI